MNNQKPIDVTVLVDSTDRNDERTCFWREFQKGHILLPKGNYNFRFISISEIVEAGTNPITEVFNKEKSKIVIINWDVLNGDPLYKSDKDLLWFQHFLPDIDQWVRNGGVLVVECQEGSRALRQEVYDLFGKALGYKLVTRESTCFCNRAHINTDLEDHPLLEGIKSEEPESLSESEKPAKSKGYEYVVQNLDLYSKQNLYPPDKYCADTWDPYEEERWQKKIHVGWFDKSKKASEWEPIIFARGKEFGKDRPIMMCRTVTNQQVSIMKASLEESEKSTIGAYIVTSMFIGSSGWLKLISNILNFHGEPTRRACVLYYKRKKAKFKKLIMSISVSVTGVALLVIVIIFYPTQLGPLFGAVITGIGILVYNYFKKIIEHATG